MIQSMRVGAFILISVIASSGCAVTGAIEMDGRIRNIGDLGVRMSRDYNGGLTKVARTPYSPRQNHYEDFSMTLFNVRGKMSDVPDMVASFRNYCLFRGGTQKEVNMYLNTPRSFSIICEPTDKYKDPAYFIFFVNVLPTRNTLSNVGGYCVNFLASENRTHNTIFTNMPGYTRVRKAFESVLKSTMAYC